MTLEIPAGPLGDAVAGDEPDTRGPKAAPATGRFVVDIHSNMAAADRRFVDTG